LRKSVERKKRFFRTILRKSAPEIGRRFKLVFVVVARRRFNSNFRGILWEVAYGPSGGDSAVFFNSSENGTFWAFFRADVNSRAGFAVAHLERCLKKSLQIEF